MGRFFDMDNRFFTFMSRVKRPDHPEPAMHTLLSPYCHSRCIHYRYVLRYPEDGTQ